MQQANEGGSEGMMKQNQDRRLTKPMMQGDNPQHHQPQKCPRCESLNTKFCYYNNYSLSQPRYFCKTCRRYWTQGGTLRNVPVGGGCRKGKRAKTSSSAASASSSENSRPQIQSHPQPLTLGTSQNMINSTTTNSGNLSGLRTKELGGTLVSPAGSGNGIPSMPMGSFYSGGGFLNSLAAIQSLSNQTLPQSFALNNHQPLSGDLGRTSNLNLLHGFNAVPSFGLQVQAQQRQFYHMGSSTENKSTSIGEHPYFATSSQSQHQNWHQDQAFISNTNPAVPDSTAFWSISTSNTPLNSTAASAGSFPLNPTDHQWRDLPGCGPPP